MIIHEKPIEWYIQKIHAREHFAVAGFSDAEWNCILGTKEGEKTGLGQIISEVHGSLLLDVLRRRQDDKQFLFAVPKCLRTMPGFDDGRIDWALGALGIILEAYERDMVTDDLARQARLYPFIQSLKNVPVVIIGNKHLRGLEFLEYKQFVEISSPNLHMEFGGISRAIDQAIGANLPDATYLVSAGVSAAVIIDRLYEALPKASFIDCGSIWDAFVGIGEQREWRAKLYENPTRLERWISENTHRTYSSRCGERAYRRDEVDQDRATDLLETFNTYGYVMFPQQRKIYDQLANWICNKFPKNSSLLEAGCGNGVGSAILERAASSIVATDKLQRNVDFAKCLYPWIDFQVWDLNKSTDLRADVVVCVEAFEHVADPNLAFRNLLEAANHELWISTPNNLGNLNPPENPYHIAEYRPKEMVAMAREASLTQLEIDILDWENLDKIQDINTKVNPLVYRIRKV